MGNRAIIKAENGWIGIYLHWNGGRDSVEAFLKYCELRGFRAPEKDGYGWARLAQVIGNYFGGGTSVGIIEINGDEGRWCDNGTYIIRDWKIVGREDFDGKEQNEYPLDEMLRDIDDAQPERDRIGDYLRAEEIDVADVKVGDVVFVRSWDGFLKEEVVGFGADRVVNGKNVLVVPYIAKWESDSCSVEMNINNYLFDEKVRVVR